MRREVCVALLLYKATNKSRVWLSAEWITEATYTGAQHSVHFCEKLRLTRLWLPCWASVDFFADFQSGATRRVTENPVPGQRKRSFRSIRSDVMYPSLLAVDSRLNFSERLQVSSCFREPRIYKTVCSTYRCSTKAELGPARAYQAVWLVYPKKRMIGALSTSLTNRKLQC